MGQSPNVFIRVAVLASSLNLLTAHPLTPPFDPDAHRVVLPPLPLDSVYSVKLTPTQQSGSEEQTSLFFPFMYHGLNNADLLPPDVELLPTDFTASSSGDKGPIFFSPASGHLEVAPYMEFMTSAYSGMPYLHHHHHGPHDHHNHHHLGGHRPVRPLHPSYYPKPTPPVWTIPPDVEVYPHEKPSCSRPSKPSHTPRPWFPPAVPSNYRSASEMNQTSQRIFDDISNNFSRSASDSDNDTNEQMPTEFEYITDGGTYMNQNQTEEIYQFPNFDALEIPSNIRPAEDSKWSRLPDQIPFRPNYEPFEEMTKVSGIYQEENGNKELPQSVGMSNPTEDSSSQMKPDSSESGFSFEHSFDVDPADVNSAADNDDFVSSTRVDGYSTSSEGYTLLPAGLDLSTVDLTNMEALQPEGVQQSVMIENAEDVLSTFFDNVTESAVGHRMYESGDSNVDTELADWISEELSREGVSGENITGNGEEIETNTSNQDNAEPEIYEVPRSARNRKPHHIFI